MGLGGHEQATSCPLPRTWHGTSTSKLLPPCILYAFPICLSHRSTGIQGTGIMFLRMDTGNTGTGTDSLWAKRWPRLCRPCSSRGMARGVPSRPPADRPHLSSRLLALRCGLGLGLILRLGHQSHPACPWAAPWSTCSRTRLGLWPLFAPRTCRTGHGHRLSKVGGEGGDSAAGIFLYQ